MEAETFGYLRRRRLIFGGGLSEVKMREKREKRASLSRSVIEF
jgi:hypothetical protein